jgi:hypothetical protein
VSIAVKRSEKIAQAERLELEENHKVMILWVCRKPRPRKSQQSSSDSFICKIQCAEVVLV